MFVTTSALPAGPSIRLRDARQTKHIIAHMYSNHIQMMIVANIKQDALGYSTLVFGITICSI